MAKVQLQNGSENVYPIPYITRDFNVTTGSSKYGDFYYVDVSGDYLIKDVVFANAINSGANRFVFASILNNVVRVYSDTAGVTCTVRLFLKG